MREYDGKYITLMLCSKCNNNCSHCYIKYKGDFTVEQLDELIPKLMEKYTVYLNGTEPILYPEYFKFFKMTNGHSILTNGLELIKNPKVMDQLHNNGINQINLSYHFGIQEQISIVKSSELDRLIVTLKENGFKIKLMTSVSSDNYLNVLDYCDKAFSLGVDKIKFTNLVNQGSAIDNLGFSKILTAEQIDYVLRQINNGREKYDINELCIQRCGTFGQEENQQNFRCLAGTDMVIITPNFDVYKCIFDIDKGNEIGIVRNGQVLINDNYLEDTAGYCKVLRKYNKVIK